MDLVGCSVAHMNGSSEPCGLRACEGHRTYMNCTVWREGWGMTVMTKEEQRFSVLKSGSNTAIASTSSLAPYSVAVHGPSLPSDPRSALQRIARAFNNKSTSRWKLPTVYFLSAPPRLAGCQGVMEPSNEGHVSNESDGWTRKPLSACITTRTTRLPKDFAFHTTKCASLIPSSLFLEIS